MQDASELPLDELENGNRMKRKERKRQRDQDAKIAAMAYRFVREETHPLRDGFMANLYKADLIREIEELSYEDRSWYGMS